MGSSRRAKLTGSSRSKKLGESSARSSRAKVVLPDRRGPGRTAPPRASKLQG